MPAHPQVDRLAPRWIAERGPMGCGLAMDTEAVYLADEMDGMIRRFPKAGGPGTVIVSHQGAPRDVAVDGEHLFWTTASSERLRRAPKAGGAFGGLAADVSGPAHLALDETDVFFTRRALTPEDDSLVRRASKRGGPAVVLARGPEPTRFPAAEHTRATALAVDERHVYFTVDRHPSGHGLLQRVPKGGGEVETVASDLLQPGSLVVDGTAVFFEASQRDGTTALYRLPKDGGSPVKIGDGGGPVVLDATDVFHPGGGGVMRVPKIGGEARLLATLPRRVLALALDEAALWACCEDGLYEVPWTPIPGPPQFLPTRDYSARAFVFDKRGRLVGGEYMGHLRAYDVTTGETGPELGQAKYVHDLGIAAGGEVLLVAGVDGTVEGWNIASGAKEWTCASKDPHGSTDGFAVSPDGTLFLLLRGGEAMRLFATATGKETRVLAERTEHLDAAAIAPDNSFMLGAVSHLRREKARWKRELEPPMRMWDLATGKQTGTFLGDEERVWQIAITPDGKRALTVGEAGVLRFWDIPSKGLVAALPARGAGGVAISRSGARALTTSEVEGTCLWDLTIPKRVACSFARPRAGLVWAPPARVAFSPAEDEAWWSNTNGYLRWKLPDR